MSDRSVNSATLMPSSKARRRLAPSEKYEIFVSVLTGQATQREAAAKWKVDRSTVTHICQVAKRGALDALSASPSSSNGREVNVGTGRCRPPFRASSPAAGRLVVS